MDLPLLTTILKSENGMDPPNALSSFDVRLIASAFSVDVSNQAAWLTLSRGYHLAARYWHVFLLVPHFILCLALLMRPANFQAVAFLLRRLLIRHNQYESAAGVRADLLHTHDPSVHIQKKGFRWIEQDDSIGFPPGDLFCNSLRCTQKAIDVRFFRIGVIGAKKPMGAINHLG